MENYTLGAKIAISLGIVLYLLLVLHQNVGPGPLQRLTSLTKNLSQKLQLTQYWMNFPNPSPYSGFLTVHFTLKNGRQITVPFPEPLKKSGVSLLSRMARHKHIKFLYEILSPNCPEYLREGLCRHLLKEAKIDVGPDAFQKWEITYHSVQSILGRKGVVSAPPQILYVKKENFGV